MKQYLDLLQNVLDNGIWQSNRTGIDTLTIPGAMLKFDLRDGFPAVTTKRLAFNQVKGELIGFLRGYTDAAQFRELGCTIWDQNANENEAWLNNPNRQGHGDLGRIYGAQWRDFDGGHPDFGGVDQIANALHTLRTDPHSRRILVSAWNPNQLDEMALPPCHVLFQLLPHVDSKVLHMTMYQRSCDLFLGIPFNIASYALLLELFAAWSGYAAGTLTMFMADTHIYVNHIDQVKEQLTRDPLPLPELVIDISPFEATTLDAETLINKIHPDDIFLDQYQSHPAISAPMAV